jgi:hypothetical protein
MRRCRDAFASALHDYDRVCWQMVDGFWACGITAIQRYPALGPSEGLAVLVLFLLLDCHLPVRVEHRDLAPSRPCTLSGCCPSHHRARKRAVGYQVKVEGLARALSRQARKAVEENRPTAKE